MNLLSLVPEVIAMSGAKKELLMPELLLVELDKTMNGIKIGCEWT